MRAGVSTQSWRSDLAQSPSVLHSVYLSYHSLQLACLDGCDAIVQVRRRRYFENYQDYLKRKEKQKHMNKRMCVSHLLLLLLVVLLATAA